MDPKMKKMISALGLTIVLGTQCIQAAMPTPDLQGKISGIMLRPGTSGSKTCVRIYFSSITGTDRFGCISNPGYIEITDDHAMVSTGRLNQMLSVALTANASGSPFAVDFAAGTNNQQTCMQGTFAYLMP
jgi:hypothetical protein